MVIIGEAVIDAGVAEARFSCDLDVCKGACCTLEGGRGAPLEDEEVLEIYKAYPIVKRYLDERNIQTIEADGLVDGTPGDYATPCIERRDCVFAYFESGIARCSFEKAYLAGETQWRKPMSCHLFPIRIRHFGKDFVRYETIEECSGGRANGESQNVALHEFLREPLMRKYGSAWYENFSQYCRSRMAERA